MASVYALSLAVEKTLYIFVTRYVNLIFSHTSFERVFNTLYFFHFFTRIMKNRQNKEKVRNKTHFSIHNLLI